MRLVAQESGFKRHHRLGRFFILDEGPSTSATFTVCDEKQSRIPLPKIASEAIRISTGIRIASVESCGPI